MPPPEPIDSPVAEPRAREPQDVASAGKVPAETALEGKGRTPPPTKVGPDALIGTVLSERYRVVSVLGEGGMGAVYLAEHTHMRKRMAIKVLHPEMSHMPEVVARFEREAMAAAHIDHPNVATATDFGKLEDGSFFLALEYIEGVSLRDVLAKGRLPVGRVLHVVRQIVQALVRAHGLGIVHRDLKPENIMLIDREGEKDFVKVLDFGIAKVPVGELAQSSVKDPSAPVLTQAGMVYGTPEYMAPEQALGQPIDARADLYALGVMAYEMLCGVRPFDDASKIRLLGMHVTAKVPPMAEKGGADVPPEVEAVVMRLLAKEATDRTADAKTLGEELDGLQILLIASGRIEGKLPTSFGGAAFVPGSVRMNGASSPNLDDAAIAASNGLPGKLGSLDLQALLRDKRVIGGAAGAVFLLVVILAVALSGGKKTVDPKSGVLPTTGSLASAADSSEAPALDPAIDPSSTIELDPAASAAVPPISDPKLIEGLGAIEKGDLDAGLALLEPYAQKPSCPPQVHRALMKAFKERDPKKAIFHARKLVQKLPQERRAIDVLVVVRDLALGENAAENEAFGLLEHGLGTNGPDVLYDIAYGDYASQYPKAAKRAQKLLAQPDVRSHADRALTVALDLRTVANTCDMKKHFDAAAQSGDKRALALLQAVPKKKGKKDPYYCLRADGSLEKTIAAIDTRLKAAP
jgi:serine/threonine-protein kinase